LFLECNHSKKKTRKQRNKKTEEQGHLSHPATEKETYIILARISVRREIQHFISTQKDAQFSYYYYYYYYYYFVFCSFNTLQAITALVGIEQNMKKAGCHKQLIHIGI